MSNSASKGSGSMIEEVMKLRNCDIYGFFGGLELMCEIRMFDGRLQALAAADGHVRFN